ncbi:MAG: DNA methyltransferase [Pseudoxanthomonas suwonensis]|nr:MAG: DNA methyltransferase [Pseudoxanthomonas suwonensis]
MAHASLVQAVNDYLDRVAEIHATGVAREHGYRPAQIDLLNKFRDTLTINDAAKSAAGFPDFTMLKRSQPEVARGYGEGKDLGDNLTRVEKTEQVARYLTEYSNLLLTNVIEFRFFLAGEPIGDPVKVGTLHRQTGELTLHRGRAGELADQLEAFLSRSPERIRSAPRLATIMAGKARLIRQLTKRLFADESSPGGSAVRNVYNLVKATLSHDMTEGEFADMYAQTMVYGLFAARFHDTTDQNFSRQEARDLIAHESDFLKAFFDHIAGASFPDDLKIVVNDLCEVFAVSDVRDIVRRHLLRKGDTEGRDPIIHFYELFLREYDAKQRKDRGVYYTPTPVVRYIIRAVDRVLVDEFGLADGLADTSRKTISVEMSEGQRFKSKAKKVTQNRNVHRVQILDPAVGTATFLNETVKNIHARFTGQEGMWPSYAKDELLPRLFGFELMMAPYSIAHLKLGMTLAELGAPQSGQVRVYLTNTLEEPANLNPDLLTFAGLAGAFSREASLAAEVKVENPIMVVVGNPPYSGHSENKFPYANELVEKYKVEPGGQVKLQERNSKWLQDDYVKFIAFTEDLIARNPDGGVMAMITNNGYLDNPTFRGMRWHLARTFDLIYVIDLHGSMKKRDAATVDGDVNVFDIQQGVAIIVAVRKGAKSDGLAQVKHADLYGSRQSKFAALDADEVEFTDVDLDPKFLFFQPRSSAGREEYASGIPLDELFYKNVIGLFTGRDKLTIDMDKQTLADRVNDFRNSDPEDARERYSLGKDVRDWAVARAQEDVNRDFSEDKFTPITYRPFDVRWTYYTGRSKGFYYYPRDAVMRDVRDDPKNYSLVVGRQGGAVGSGEWTLAYVARGVVDLNIFYRGGGMVFPLRMRDKAGDWHSNVTDASITKLSGSLSARPSSPDVFDYVYGVLNSPLYRAKSSEFLKSDFPLIPIPADDEEFRQLTEFGARVRELHLLESADTQRVSDLTTTFPISGSNAVTGRRFDDSKVWINDTQYLGNVPRSTWEYTVGGYQVLDKWLKDRKDRQLSQSELLHLQRMATAIGRVVEAQDELSRRA